MKRLLFVIAIIFGSMQLKASHESSELNLRLFDQSQFIVTLNNEDFNTPVTRFNIDFLNPGSHYLRVTRITQSYYHHFSHPVVVFNGYINIPEMSKVYAMIDRQFRFRINKIVPLFAEPIAYVPQPLVPVYYGMHENEFEGLKRTIDRLSFDSSRIQVAKQAISSNNLTSRQVGEVIRLLTFESSKLEIAKYAYHKTIDKQNYFLINDQFTFESSIVELNNYIFRS